jgi:hypothetical protein
MNTGWIWTIGFVLAPSLCLADVYVKGVLHIEGGYRYGHNVPDSEVINEWWFGKDRMVFSSRGWSADWGGNRDLSFIYDRKQRRLWAIDLTARSYVEVALPMNVEELVEPWMADSLRQSIMDCQATHTGKTEVVLGRVCEEYELREWFVRKDDRHFDLRRTILVGSNLPFDHRLFDDVYLWSASFYQPQPRCLAALKEMQGFIMKSQDDVYEGGSRVRFAFEVSEITEADAPPGTYNPPPDHVRQSKLTYEHMFALRAVMFLYSLY